MVPVFAWCSFFALGNLDEAPWFEAVTSCYEGFVIYSFFNLLLNYLGEDHIAQKTKIAQHPPGKIFFPWGKLFGWSYNPKSGGFLVGCKRWALQYAVVHPFISIVYIILETKGKDSYSFTNPMVYFVIFDFISVSLAMNALVQFWIVIGLTIFLLK